MVVQKAPSFNTLSLAQLKKLIKAWNIKKKLTQSGIIYFLKIEGELTWCIIIAINTEWT